MRLKNFIFAHEIEHKDVSGQKRSKMKDKQK